MATFQQVLDNIAIVIGGTAPDPVNIPGWYSGAIMGDSTGVAGLSGCYSRPPEASLTYVSDLPTAVILPGRFTIKRGVPEENIDHLRLLVLAANNDESNWAVLNPMRDLVPAAMRAKMQIQPAGGTTLTPSVLEVPVVEGQPIVHVWAATELIGWEFILRLFRSPIQTYTA